MPSYMLLRAFDALKRLPGTPHGPSGSSSTSLPDDPQTLHDVLATNKPLSLLDTAVITKYLVQRANRLVAVYMVKLCQACSQGGGLRGGRSEQSGDPPARRQVHFLRRLFERCHVASF